MEESIEFENYQDTLEEQAIAGNLEYFQHLAETGELELLKNSDEIDMREVAQMALEYDQYSLLNFFLSYGIIPDRISDVIAEGRAIDWVIEHNINFLDTDDLGFSPRSSDSMDLWFSHPNLTRMLLNQGHRPPPTLLSILIQDRVLPFNDLFTYLNILADYGIYPDPVDLGSLVFLNLMDSRRVLQWISDKGLQVNYSRFYKNLLDHNGSIDPYVRQMINLGIEVPPAIFQRVLKEYNFTLANELYTLGYRPTQNYVNFIYLHNPRIASWLLQRNILSTQMEGRFKQLSNQLPYFV